MISTMKSLRGLSVEVIYREQRAQLGRMNDTLYRMPPFFATVVGGLWFFAAQYLEKDRIISAGVFLFAATCAIAAVFAIQRYRVVLLAYVASVEYLEDRFSPPVPRTRVRTTTTFMALLTVGAILSLMGAAYALAWPSLKC